MLIYNFTLGHLDRHLAATRDRILGGISAIANKCDILLGLPSLGSRPPMWPGTRRCCGSARATTSRRGGLGWQKTFAREDGTGINGGRRTPRVRPRSLCASLERHDNFPFGARVRRRSLFHAIGSRPHQSMPPWDSSQNNHQLSPRPPSSPPRCNANLANIQTRRSSSSASIGEQITSLLPPAPAILADATVWGATGILLTNFHTHLHLPYWACISLTNVLIRSAMIPVAVRGARTSVKFGTISPEVQYLITTFTNDMKTLNFRGRWSQEGSYAAMQTFAGKRQLITATLSTLRSLFLLKKVNLLDIFKVCSSAVLR